MPGDDAPHGSLPSLFEPTTLVFSIVIAVLGAVIGLEIISRIGINPNSSVIAAVAAIAVSRVPIGIFAKFRDIHRQNLLQTTISGATYGAGNGLLLPLGVIWLTGGPSLIPAILLGAMLGLLIDATLLFWLFDSRLYPASGLWPPGVATAQCIEAGARGGSEARLLGIGGLIGALGQSLGVPMDVFGVCWIGNIWALSMFGLGLLARAYAPVLWGIELDKLYAPHGIMIGAGVVALMQMAVLIARGNRSSARSTAPDRPAVLLGILGSGLSAFVLAASAMAGLAGLASGLGWMSLAGFVLFAAVAALTSELIAGIAAMHSGWFPVFATALIFLMVGMALGFPPLALALLVGFTSATGPAFADMAYDLKAGWILRGRGAHPDFERRGRRQQYLAELLGLLVAGVVVALFHESYFSRDLFPPVDRVFAATIEAGAAPDLAGSLLLWAIPGAIVQLLGGPNRQLGVLFATGLLIYLPAAGWAALASLTVRFVLERRFKERASGPMYILAGGFIAGSAITNFSTATWRIRG